MNESRLQASPFRSCHMTQWKYRFNYIIVALFQDFDNAQMQLSYTRLSFVFASCWNFTELLEPQLVQEMKRQRSIRLCLKLRKVFE